MYVLIGETTYRRVKNISFSPEISVVGSELPINRFQVDIITDDPLSAGSDIQLFDDLDNLWASYWITFAEKVDKYTVRVVGESKLALLDRDTMEAKMYTNYPVPDIINDIFSGFDSSQYSLDLSFNNAVINGYLGHHSKRYRLQLVCFAIGAYVKTYFNDKIEILPLDESETLIPKNKTYWKPSITYKDYVTSIAVTRYAYTQGEPQRTDEYVEADGVTYIQTSQVVRLQNPDVPVTAPPNEITVDDVTIINENNVSDIISRLSVLYFKRTSVDADVINNAEYVAGEKVTVQIDEETMATGFIESEDFRFGLQAKSRIHLAPIDIRESAMLEIKYLWDDFTIGQSEYLLPVDYVYSIQNPYISMTFEKHRYVFRPENEYATGTMIVGGVTDEEECFVALDLYQKVLDVISVDEVVLENGVAEIA